MKIVAVLSAWILSELALSLSSGHRSRRWRSLIRPDREGVKGLNKALSNFDVAKEGVLQRITAPTSVITADRSKMNSVEKVWAYQVQIPNSRLVVIRSDAYHIASANAGECVTQNLAFLNEQKVQK
jgi:pimeloyl-ACP methyl ester carboxylesterase